MSPRLLADAVLLLHLAFVLFVVAGAGLSWRWPRLVWLHLPALIWGGYAMLTGTVCPLTPLENELRAVAGQGGYDGSFIEQYLLPLVYPDAVQGPMGRGLQMLLGVAVLLLNALAYGWLVWRARRRG